MFIPMYTPTTLQAPRGHMTRPQTYAIGHKVNSLLFEPSLSTCETWLLPHAWTLPKLKYNRDDHRESKDKGQAWKRRRKKSQLLQAPDIRPQPGHPALPASPDIRPQPAHPAPITARVQKLNPTSLDIRPEARTSGSSRAAGHPAPARKSGARYPESRSIGHSSPDIRPASPDIRHLVKARTSGPTPGHPASPACVQRIWAEACTPSPLRLYILPLHLRFRVSFVIARLR